MNDDGGCPGRPKCALAGRLSYAIFTLARAHRGLAAELLRELGLHPGQELVLMHLLDRDGQTQSELLDAIGLDHSTLSKSLSRMQDAGLIERIADEHDRRVWHVRLTDAGRAMGPRIAAMWSTLEEVTAAGLDLATLDAFIEFTRQIEESIQRFSRERDPA